MIFSSHSTNNPASPQQVGALGVTAPGPRHATAVAFSGKHAFLMDFGLHVIDVSNPASPQRVGGYASNTVANDITVSGDYAFIADAAVGLQIVDVSDPARPRHVGGYRTSDSPMGVALSGNYAFVAYSCHGLQVIDISNPTNPQWVRAYDTPGITSGLAVWNKQIYLADGHYGLLILPSLTDVQFTVRVEAIPNETFTLETTSDLNPTAQWTPLLTTNVNSSSFDYVDRDVKTALWPQKFYRVRQP
jgi:hypothetical protein